MMKDALYTRLPNRASIILSGDSVDDFLQNLITQDINLLKSQPLIYSCLLTPQGKFLFDFFIYKDKNAYIIDCEGGVRANTLLQRLSMYKLRAKIELEFHDDIEVWQVFSAEELEVADNSQLTFRDPRHELCGYRCYQKPETFTETSFDKWDEFRIRLEIPDGSRDLIPDKSFIHEGRLDDFNAVSYKKGCYLGQELVSRMHHRGLTKKILRCVEIENIPEKTELRSSCGKIGLALVRI